MSPESSKRAWWKIALGAGLIVVEINSLVSPAPNLLKASNADQQLGMNVVTVAIVALGLWLIYSGSKPAWRKSS